MIVLQMFIIPFVVLLLLGAVFAIGSQVAVFPRDINESDPDASMDNNPDPIQVANPRLPATNTSSKESSRPVAVTTEVTLNSNECQLSTLTRT